MKKKIILIGMLILLLVLTTGCSNLNHSTDVAYFDMPEHFTRSSERMDFCDNICDNWDVRINKYQHENEVLYDNGDFICKCY